MDELTSPSTAVVESGTVRVALQTHRGVEPVWQALRDPSRLACWFGRLDRPWRIGQLNRVDFGDGDFFDVLPHTVTEPSLIAFAWRFLGVGPPAHIRWTVTAAPSGTDVVVEDRADERTEAEADQLLAGWTDFWQRLAHYLDTGRPSRYDWREDIDGTVDVPDGAGWLLAPDRIDAWLPIAGDGFGPRWFFVVDEDGPRRFRLTDWRTHPDEVCFSVEVPEAESPTSCTVTLTRTGRGRRLGFTHSGWHDLGLPERRALLLRQRFTAAWVAALRHARALAADTT